MPSVAPRPSRQIRPCRAPVRLSVNGQLSNKAYRLDHSLQTHFSERERRQNNLRFVATAGRHRAISMAAARQGFGKCGLQMAAWRMAAKWRRRNGVSSNLAKRSGARELARLRRRGL